MSASTEVNHAPGDASVLHGLLRHAAGADLPAWPEAAAQWRLCRVERGGTLFSQDIIHPFVYAVRQGLLKLVYLDADGREWIKSFSFEGRYFASIAALEPQGRTSFMVQAIEEAVVERIDHRALQALAARHLAWSRALLALTQQFAARKEQRERELLTLSAEQRYLAFCREFPQLAGRVHQKDLARHLGLTPVGLNRIVMRLRRAEAAA